jgi:pantothenate kinase
MSGGVGMTAEIDLAGLAGIVAARAAAGRVLCAIAGAPGSGKSTLAERLSERLNAGSPGTAAVLPMDGFHYDDLHLVPAGLRPVKGSPPTFDVGGLFHILKRLKAADEDFVAVPVFDRAIEIARAGARLIAAEVPVILVEGNYLLLSTGDWPRLRPLFDVTVMVEVPEPVLRERLRSRWEGFGLSEDEIAWKLDGNDLPNGRLIARDSAPADYRIANG